MPESPHRQPSRFDPPEVTPGEALRTFFVEAFSDRGVGAVAPTSRALARSMVEIAGVGNASRIVELGAGTGAVTAEIVLSKQTTASVLVLEQNARFAALLADRFPDIHVRCDCASQLQTHRQILGESAADCILCSLPWTCFDEDLTLRILRATASTLDTKGVFTTVACHGLHATQKGRRFRENLHQFFKNVRSEPVDWRNLPPAFLYRCEAPLSVT